MSSVDPSPPRSALRSSNRILIKAGTSVVTSPNGYPSLTRLASLVEQIAELKAEGKQVILVSSGAVGMGRHLLLRQMQGLTTVSELQKGSVLGTSSTKNYSSSCAAAGQFHLMSIYNSLFESLGLVASQILLTQNSFEPHTLPNLTDTIEKLLALNIIPIINENDAVSSNQGWTSESVFSDNDSLASVCSKSFNCSACLLLTDVEGVYNKPPSQHGATVLPFFETFKCIESGLTKSKSSDVLIGEKSEFGRGGMQAKIDAAASAVEAGGCDFCLITSGLDFDSIRDACGAYNGKKAKGTLFVSQQWEGYQKFVEMENADGGEDDEGRRKALKAREEARKLTALGKSERSAVLLKISASLADSAIVSKVMQANAVDLENAVKQGLDSQLLNRLKLTPGKLETLSTGIKQIAESEDPLGVIKSVTELASGLTLNEVTCPIGVLMIIFESRPDSLPQIASLSIASGNGLLLKGGSEAKESNKALHKAIGDAVEEATGGKVKRDIVALVESRSEISQLLKLDDCVDLVIPRGSNKLVHHIKSHTKIPVLGHADGVCHIFIDSTASPQKSTSIVVDSKTTYPSACNSVETILLHEETLTNGLCDTVLKSLRQAGCKILGGPRAMSSGICDIPSESSKQEYGDLRVQVEVVVGIDEAVEWVNRHGSGHTECIVTEDEGKARRWMEGCDSACVFWNASTRFADGYRFGMGAEVGISTGRIHARGPCGVKSLLTTKWMLESNDYDTTERFNSGERVYTHIVKK
ncbi:hypothetical protein TrVE_jg2270 [Triparma verrucosa]|uniref:Delta-1-pyrroline-5-carboxylate synthase n=1 Tax=Triparma verrucosa TaxID=1606542 RepID=A0A9W7FEA4_9STRA|nr:hypothetical protein TrVE_jg2270 [Triparma verrucosa]